MGEAILLIDYCEVGLQLTNMENVSMFAAYVQTVNLCLATCVFAVNYAVQRLSPILC